MKERKKKEGNPLQKKFPLNCKSVRKTSKDKRGNELIKAALNSVCNPKNI